MSETQQTKSTPLSGAKRKIRFQPVLVSVFLLSAFLLIPTFGSPHLNARAAGQAPDHFVNNVFAELSVLYQENPGVMAIEDELVIFYYRYFDHHRISRFVLGKTRRRISDDEFQKFDDLFPLFLLRLLVPQLDRYFPENGDLDGEFRVVDVKKIRRDTMVSIEFIGQKSSQQTIKANLRLRQSEGQWKILDIEIAGVSMLLTQRDIIGGLLTSHNFDFAAFLQELEADQT